jgi:hypothetical protein
MWTGQVRKVFQRNDLRFGDPLNTSRRVPLPLAAELQPDHAINLRPQTQVALTSAQRRSVAAQGGKMSSERMLVYHLVVLFVAAVSIVGCGTSNTPASPSALASGSGAASAIVDGIVEIPEFEVCKFYSGTPGPAVRIDYTVDFDANGSNEITDFVELGDGECAIVHTYDETDSNNGLQVQLVTVTEAVPPGYSAACALSSIGAVGGVPIPGTCLADNSASGAMTSNPDNGFLVEFTNTEDPVSGGTGRFTGGGNQLRVDGVRVTRGLTIHCDLLLSNNLEVNWNGNSFHMTEHLLTVACTDDPNITQAPPAAPLDTLVGVGEGRYNGVDGYTIEFTLVDYGEPGTEDEAALLIYETANPGNVVLDVPQQRLDHGNLQAHFDQPHK